MTYEGDPIYWIRNIKSGLFLRKKRKEELLNGWALQEIWVKEKSYFIIVNLDKSYDVFPWEYRAITLLKLSINFCSDST